ncbi:MAG: hypothetical protein OQK51_03320 [Kangiellaceae bacterium]|nr:hypothetical protein [Kangiellaceae bacterium]
MFDLSGNKLTLVTPKGNWNQLPAAQGNYVPQTNLFDQDLFKVWGCVDWSKNRLIFERHYIYGSFNHPIIAGVNLRVYLVKVNLPEVNLFDDEDFKATIENRNLQLSKEFNKNIEDEFLLVNPAKEFEFVNVGENRFMYYENIDQLRSNPVFTIPLTAQHYIAFDFKYDMLRDGEDGWYSLAKDLEKQIIQSVKLELTESFKQEKASVKG